MTSEEFEKYRKKQLENPEPGIEEEDWLDYTPGGVGKGKVINAIGKYSVKHVPGGGKILKRLMDKGPEIKKYAFPVIEKAKTGLEAAEQMKTDQLKELFKKLYPEK